MTQFLRLLKEQDKGAALASAASHVRSGEDDPRHFEVESDSFGVVPGAPFAYWAPTKALELFSTLGPLSARGHETFIGLHTSDDWRFVRLWWETCRSSVDRWLDHPKGGPFIEFYARIHLTVLAENDFEEIVAYSNARYPYLNNNARSLMHADLRHSVRSGITWTYATTSSPSFRCFPAGCICGMGGPALHVAGDDPYDILVMTAVLNSSVFTYLVSLGLGLAAEGRKNYGIADIAKCPIPAIPEDSRAAMFRLAQAGWVTGWLADTVNETSHAFLLPALLRSRLGPYDPPAIEAELARIQQEIDDICFDLYGFDAADRAAMTQVDAPSVTDGSVPEDEDTDDAEEDEEEATGDNQSTLLSWCVGVAFGRFDLRLATGKRAMPPEPGPFDPLPSQSPGMLPDGVAPFHRHAGILVDDQGNPHDLPKLVEDVLEEVGVQVPVNVRDWLQRDFFAFHLKQYSKSRRKAPIYWPLSTPSGSYTLWVYYPTLTDQTLYTAVNDFVDPKLRHVTTELTTLRGKATRTREETKKLEELQDLSKELADLREALLEIAPTYHPDQDDGVQITAAPLWSLFRAKPWSKLLKDTWAKLAKGDYDWAHLAMQYWPDRVRAKCQSDKSLAIAHHLDELYTETEHQPTKEHARR